MRSYLHLGLILLKLSMVDCIVNIPDSEIWSLLPHPFDISILVTIKKVKSVVILVIFKCIKINRRKNYANWYWKIYLLLLFKTMLAMFLNPSQVKPKDFTASDDNHSSTYSIQSNGNSTIDLESISVFRFSLMNWHVKFFMKRGTEIRNIK